MLLRGLILHNLEVIVGAPCVCVCDAPLVDDVDVAVVVVVVVVPATTSLVACQKSRARGSSTRHATITLVGVSVNATSVPLPRKALHLDVKSVTSCCGGGAVCNSLCAKNEAMWCWGVTPKGCRSRCLIIEW